MNPYSYTHIFNPIRTCAHIHSHLTDTVSFFFFEIIFLEAGISRASPDYNKIILVTPGMGPFLGSFF